MKKSKTASKRHLWGDCRNDNETTKTIAQVLKSAKPGDMLTDGKRYWRVNRFKFDSCMIASPCAKDGRPVCRGFELWSKGIETVAVIPGLRVMSR
jgi:hypothetical protein